LIYTDVNKEEAQRTHKILEKALIKKFKLVYNWHTKIKNAFSKLKTLIILSSKMRKMKIRNKYPKKNDLIKLTNSFYNLNIKTSKRAVQLEKILII